MRIRGFFAGLTALVLLTGCGRDDAGMSQAPSAEGEWEMKQKSFGELAQILKDFGVEGITEDVIRQLEDGEAMRGDEFCLDRTASLLMWAGSGTTDWDNMVWTPAENGVYTFDREVFRLETMYTDFLRGVSALGGKELSFENIREDTGGVDWERGTGRRTVSFDWDGESYVLEAENHNDWFDVSAADALNRIILSRETGKSLYFATDGYQECIVFYRDSAWAEAFQTQTGLELFQFFAR